MRPTFEQLGSEERATAVHTEFPCYAMNNVSQRKALRKPILNLRSTLSSKQQQQASHLIIQQTLRTHVFLRSQRIAFYIPHRNEVNTQLLIEKAFEYGKRCYLPILHPIKHNQMWFGAYQQGDVLKENYLGILEPNLAVAEKVAPWSLDLVITPLVAFDQQGNRLGMGGGYYDRTFSFLKSKQNRKPKLMGLAYHFQQLETIPAATWDIALDYVITEVGSISFR